MGLRPPMPRPYIHHVRTGHRCATTQVSPWDLDPSLKPPPQQLRSTGTLVTAAELEPVVEVEKLWEERDR